MRLIDANDFIEKMHELYEQAKWGKREIHFSLADLECNVDMMPTTDAIPVIRCNECKHLLKNDRIAPNWWRICDYWRTGVDENEYCARGERKEE